MDESKNGKEYVVELSMSILVWPCCTSLLLWLYGSVRDFEPDSPGSIPSQGKGDTFQHLPIHSLDDILKLECTDGSCIRYACYIQAEISAV